MKRKVTRAIALAIMLTLIAAFAAAGQTTAIAPVDYFGVKMAPGNYKRVVSLAPNITETVYFVGQFKRLVGVTNYDTYPPEVSGLAKVGGFVDPDLEIILSLKPDLVLAYRGNPLPAVNKLKELGLHVFVLDSPQTLDELCRQTVMIARLLQADKKHMTLAEGLSKRISEARSRAAKLPAHPKILMLAGSVQPPYYAAGRGNYIDDLITSAGGVNAFTAQGFSIMTPEAFLSADPEFLIIPEPAKDGFRKAMMQALAREPQLAATSAVKQKNIIFIEEDVISRPGPRIIHALSTIQEAIAEYVAANEKD
jgi:iron complex transport system substrate-binding protein